MNRKQFLILVVLVVVLGGLGLKYWSGKSASWNGGGAALGQKLLGDFDVNAVSQIVVKHGAEELTLAKKNDLWRVAQRGDYPANFTEISGLLMKLKDLKIVQTETVGPSQLPRLELATGASNGPTVVEFRDASGKEIKSLLLGKKHVRKGQGSPTGDMDDGGFPDGRYVIASGGAADRVLLISDPLSNLEPHPAEWVSKDFIKVEKAVALAATFPVASNSWILERTDANASFKLNDGQPGEELDPNKVSGMTSPFSSITVVDVVPGAKPEDTGLAKPTVITIGTVEGFTYTFNVGTKTNDNYYLTVSIATKFEKERAAIADEKPEDKTKRDKEFADNLKRLEEKLAQEKAFESWTFLVSSWPVDALLKERHTLMVEKKAPETKDAATPPVLVPEDAAK